MHIPASLRIPLFAVLSTAIHLPSTICTWPNPSPMDRLSSFCKRSHRNPNASNPYTDENISGTMDGADKGANGRNIEQKKVTGEGLGKPSTFTSTAPTSSGRNDEAWQGEGRFKGVNEFAP
ncbi:hypothetical protein CC80DRAFT_565105 [Byssothecium circinans]|uniref:Uncharacterized protein n=1 Tax=Byssothecium circinans TaxID=147558 RepID=A0A6A5UI99_9PLEO|nr:hypothetical protein CC80DRAFT_565105 [Byssothecium circinans]